MKKLMILLALLAPIVWVSGQSVGPIPKYPVNITTLCPTNLFQLTIGGSAQVQQITAFNHAATDVYLLVIYTNAIPTVGHPANVFIGTVFSGLTAVYTYPTGKMIRGTTTLTNAYLIPSLTPASYTNVASAVSLDILSY